MLLLAVVVPLGAVLGATLWVMLAFAGIRHSIPRRNEDFDLAGLRLQAAAPRANPAAEFYAGSRAASLLGAALRKLEALAPGWVTAAALRLFFTPLPWKLAARK